MSNVLIGIIGVILFIGLALAGALILGDDFKSASRDAKATALMSQMQQVSQALDMYRLKTGADFPSYVQINGDARMIPRFLKTSYIEPEGKGWPVVYDFTGGRYVILGALSDSMCRTIQMNVTGSETYPQTENPPAGQSNGCFKLANGNIVVYVKI